jgi:polyferredoxin
MLLGLLVALAAPPLAGDPVLAQYIRETDVVPTDADIGDGYQTPPVQRPLPRAAWWDAVDAAVLTVALGLAAWIVLRRRSRYALVGLTITCLLYFGFYREGCVCPIGAIQNVAVALVDATHAIPLVVIFFFLLPLTLALLFGRVFCGGVCPLGAIQELVVLRPVQVPRRLDRGLGILKYIYLLVAVWWAARPAVDRDFIICRFDPFVGFFRLIGPGDILIFGGVLLLLGTVVGRPYCRYLCPYGALLALVSRLSWRGVTITPDKELDCGLCVESCPYGAVTGMRAVRSACLCCARCFDWCPRERVRQASEADTAASSLEARGST